MNLLNYGVDKRLIDVATNCELSPRWNESNDKFNAIFEKLGLMPKLDPKLMDELEDAVLRMMADTEEVAYRMGVSDGYKLHLALIDPTLGGMPQRRPETPKQAPSLPFEPFDEYLQRDIEDYRTYLSHRGLEAEFDAWLERVEGQQESG